MLLDPHNLSEHQKMPTQSIAIFAILHCHLPFLANLEMIVFNIQTSYGGQKPSELNHKVNHGDKNYLSQSLGCQNELLHLHNFLPCILEGRGVLQRRLVYSALRDLSLVSEEFL